MASTPAIDEVKEAIATQQELFDACTDLLEMSPEDEEALQSVADAKVAIADLKVQLASLEAEKAAVVAASSSPPPPPPAAAATPQFTASGTSSPVPGPPLTKEPLVTFQVNDTVMAKYSADRAYYPATVVSRTGSNQDPIYKVKFHGYNEYETKNKSEVKSSLKRKADDTPSVSTTQAPERKSGGTVISAAASIDMSKMNKKEPSMVGDGPAREKPAPKKLKRGKQLEESKNSWKEFMAKGPNKVNKRPVFQESQFRTQDQVPVKKGESLPSYTNWGPPVLRLTHSKARLVHPSAFASVTALKKRRSEQRTPSRLALTMATISSGIIGLHLVTRQLSRPRATHEALTNKRTLCTITLERLIRVGTLSRLHPTTACPHFPTRETTNSHARSDADTASAAFRCLLPCTKNTILPQHYITLAEELSWASLTGSTWDQHGLRCTACGGFMHALAMANEK